MQSVSLKEKQIEEVSLEGRIGGNMREELIEERWSEDLEVVVVGGAYCAETESLQSRSASVTHPCLSFFSREVS